MSEAMSTTQCGFYDESSVLLPEQMPVPQHELNLCSLPRITSPGNSLKVEKGDEAQKEISNIEKVQCALEKTSLQNESLECTQAESNTTKTNMNASKDDMRTQTMSPGKKKLYSWLNKQMKIEMTDGRVLVGIFLCTDRDANVILGSCTEYLNPEVCGFTDEPRILGLVMVPGRHIISIHHDSSSDSAVSSDNKE